MTDVQDKVNVRVSGDQVDIPAILDLDRPGLSLSRRRARSVARDVARDVCRLERFPINNRLAIG